MGKIIGREGNTAKSIRTLLRIVGMKNNSRVNLKINEPAGGAPKERVMKTADEALDDLKLKFFRISGRAPSVRARFCLLFIFFCLKCFSYAHYISPCHGNPGISNPASAFIDLGTLLRTENGAQINPMETTLSRFFKLGGAIAYASDDDYADRIAAAAFLSYSATPVSCMAHVGPPLIFKEYEGNHIEEELRDMLCSQADRAALAGSYDLTGWKKFQT